MTKLRNQDFFVSPPFPMSGASVWRFYWEELKVAGYELHSEKEILDHATYPDDPDSQGTSYCIKKEDFNGTFREAVIHYFGEQEAKNLFSECQAAIDLAYLRFRPFALQQEVEKRWRTGKFLDHGDPLVVRVQEYPHLDWVDYESYMQAQLLKAIPDEIGVLLVKFPPDGAEDNRLHTHPRSDRLITVISGSGEFVRYWGGKVESFPLVEGNRVWMPRGIVHTFRASKDGLLVESLHNPFVELSSSNCLTYPKLEIAC